MVVYSTRSAEIAAWPLFHSCGGSFAGPVPEGGPALAGFVDDVGGECFGISVGIHLRCCLLQEAYIKDLSADLLACYQSEVSQSLPSTLLVVLAMAYLTVVSLLYQAHA